MKQKKKFIGPLAKPIVADFRSVGLLTYDKEAVKKHNDQEIYRILGTKLNKLLLLFDHYDIKLSSDAPSIEDYVWLCLRLAIDFVPGFSVKYDQKGPGRKKIWNAWTYTLLLSEIELIKQENQCGDREACKIYLQRQKKPNGLAQIKVIEARLVESRKRERNPFATITERLSDERLREFWRMVKATST